MSKPECDFCSFPEIKWEYPTRDFVLPLWGRTSFLSLGGWAACEKCYELIESGDARKLRKRMANELGVDLSRNPATAAILAREIQEFFRDRTGPPTPILVQESRRVA